MNAANLSLVGRVAGVTGASHGILQRTGTLRALAPAALGSRTTIVPFFVSAAIAAVSIPAGIR